MTIRTSHPPTSVRQNEGRPLVANANRCRSRVSVSSFLRPRYRIHVSPPQLLLTSSIKPLLLDPNLLANTVFIMSSPIQELIQIPLDALEVAIPLVLITTALFYVVYQRFFHPLASIPGPLGASLSRIWMTKHSWDGKKHIFVAEHQSLTSVRRRHESHNDGIARQVRSATPNRPK